jgi:hypothetical protein
VLSYIVTVLEALKEISNGNEDAHRFMRSFYLWVQVQDDLFDKDQEVTASQLVSANMNLLIEVSQNPFYQEHRAVFLPVIFSASLAWVSSEDFKKREAALDRLSSQVIKSQYQDVFFQVALLVGGMDFCLAMQAKYRSYYFDATS